MPTKIDLHAFHINLYLHEIFGLILFFVPHPWSEREIWRQMKRNQIFEAGKVIPTKFSVFIHLMFFITSGISGCSYRKGRTKTNLKTTSKLFTFW